MTVDTFEPAGSGSPPGGADASAGWGPSPGYRPGLDGLRALAVLAVFVLHANLGFGSGGFLGVSTFFALSGFLITALLAGERARIGRVDLPAFWLRRARRLLPAAVVTIAVIVVATTAFGDATQIRSIRGDAVSALLYVANWRFLVAGDTYGAAFSSSSPLLHFWSLAIEEQFYLVFPLVFVGALRLWRRWKWAVSAVLGGLLALSLVDGIALSTHASMNRLYYGTDVRAAELLVGAIAAWWWTTHRDLFERRVSPLLPVAGPVALAAMVFLVAIGKTTQLAWYRGGLAGYACLSIVVVLAAMQPGTVVQRALSWPPLVWIGVTSYGAYLVHWPLFQWLGQHTSMPGGARLVIGSLASVGLATVSFVLIEHPMRTTRAMPRWAYTVAPAAFVVVALSAPSIVPMTPVVAADIPIDQSQARFKAELQQQPTVAGRPRVAMFGDSTALQTALGLATWSKSPDANITAVEGWTDLGCSMLSPITYTVDHVKKTTPPFCTGYLHSWEVVAVASQPDLAVIQAGPWETTDIHLPGSAGYQHLGDRAIDDAERARLKAAADGMLRFVPRVVLFTSPHIVPGMVDGKPPPTPWDQGDPARLARYNEIVREVAATDPRIVVLDFGGHIDRLPGLERLRPDGVHLTPDAAAQVAQSWLGAQLVAIARSGHP